jgi:ureidoglycolate lyase
MRSIKAEPLSVEAFLPYGFYANLIDPKTEKLGAAPIEFFRDMVQQDLGGVTTASFSTCRVERRDLIIDVTEYHGATGEGILPLDDDILIHVGPATAADASPPLERLRVFTVPRGTMIVLRPGVWHHAPFALNAAAVNVLIALPERTYANDCRVVSLGGTERIRVVI